MKQGSVCTNATEHATSAHGTATELATSGPSPFYETKLKERMYDDASLERRRQEQVAQARKRIEARQKNTLAEKWLMQDDGQETGAADGVHAGSNADHANTEVPKPVEERMFQNLRKDVLDPLYAACTVDQDTNEWIVPAEETRLKIDRFYWHRALGDDFPHSRTILSCTAKFFLLEVDHNRNFKPRLDIVLTFSNESGASSSSSQTQLSVRYHPGAKLIWSDDPQPSEAMQKRMKLAAKKMNFKL